jgi:hypothetical protein
MEIEVELSVRRTLAQGAHLAPVQWADPSTLSTGATALRNLSCPLQINFCKLVGR